MDNYQYYAFISYARKDEYWAKWLHRKLERYRLPNILRKEYEGKLPERLKPVFLDETDISLGSLDKTLTGELERSRYLIVVCSPAAAASDWVNNEVKHFVSLNRADRIIPFIVEGTPVPATGAGDEQCYPEALSKLLLGASLAELGKERAFIKIVAFLLGLKFDELWKRTERERKRNLRIRIATVAVLAVLFTIAGYKFYDNYQEKKKAKREELLSKATNMANNAQRLEISYPSKALWLYANAYYLNPTDTFFGTLKSFYEKRITAFDDFADSSLHPIGTFNLFPRQLSPAFEYDTDTLDINYDDLVKFSLKNKLILTLDHDKVLVRNFETNAVSEIIVPGQQIVNWTYNEKTNAVLMFTEDANDNNDIIVYHLATKQQESLFQKNSANQQNPMLRYFVSNDRTSGATSDNLMETNFEMGFYFYSMPGTPYVFLYNRHRMLGGRRQPDRKIGLMSLDDPSVLELVSLTGDVQYDRMEIWSVDPGGDMLVMRMKDMQEHAKIFAFHTTTNKQMLLEIMSNRNSPTTVSWVTIKGVQYCMMGDNYGTMRARDLFSFTEHTFMTYQVDEDLGEVTVITSDETYIIAGTANGYILVWKKDFPIYGTHAPIVYNVISMWVADEAIEDIMIEGRQLMFRDASNAVSSCRLEEKIILSKDIETLKSQLDKMNMDRLSAKDSMTYGVY